MNSLSRLVNQGILVINGTQGIAPAVILKAAERKATVLFTAQPERRHDAEQLLAEASTAGLSDRISFISANLTDEQAVERLVDSAADRLPELSVLIHNLEPQAALEDRPLVEISLDEWNQVLSTELRLPFMLTRRVVEEFLFSQAPGRIVFLGYSDKDHVSASYSTAQAGLRALVRCITKEFGRREVACNAVFTSWDDRRSPELASGVTETILFFASRESSFVNGEFLHVDGGPRESIRLGTNGDK
jgi:NAD(P)-dependent dehydrogenase (short-subunit alcohol dehydrogenase family)